MPRISPVPRCNPRPSRGFTLVETVVALAIAVVLTFAVSGALVVSIKNEEASRAMRAEAQWAGALQAHVYGETPEEDWTGLLDAADWSAENEQVEIKGPTSTWWQVWTLQPKHASAGSGAVYCFRLPP